MEWGRGERSVNVAVEVRRWNCGGGLVDGGALWVEEEGVEGCGSGMGGLGGLGGWRWGGEWEGGEVEGRAGVPLRRL